jgi:hypothetical protein
MCDHEPTIIGDEVWLDCDCYHVDHVNDEHEVRVNLDDWNTRPIEDGLRARVTAPEDNLLEAWKQFDGNPEAATLTRAELLEAAEPGLVTMCWEGNDGIRRANEYVHDTQHIMGENCAQDEKHCTCVPALRARIKELEGLQGLADQEHDQLCNFSGGIIETSAEIEILKKKLAQTWTLCVDRLPEEPGRYLVSLCNGDIDVDSFDGYKFEKWFASGVAWQPLPAPYEVQP